MKIPLTLTLLLFFTIVASDPAAPFSALQTTFSCSLISTSKTVGSLWQFEVAAKDENGQAYAIDDLEWRGNLTLKQYSENNRNIVEMMQAQQGKLFETISWSPAENGNWIVSFGTTVAGIHELQMQARVKGRDEYENVSSACNITATPSVYSTWFSSQQPELMVGEAGKFLAFNVTMLDVYGNALSSFNASQASMEIAYDPATVKPGALITPFQVNITKVDEEKILFQARNNLTGNANLSVSVDKTLFEGRIKIMAAERKVPASTAQMSFFNAPKIVALTQSSLIVTAKDAFGNEISSQPAESDQFYLLLNQTTSDSDLTFTGVSYEYQAEAENGKYKVSFGPIKQAGHYVVSLMRAGEHIQGSPHSTLFQVLPDEVDSVKSELIGIPSEMQVGTEYPFSVIARDAWGNNILDGAAAQKYLEVSVIREKGEILTVLNTTFTGKGVFEGTIKLEASGKHTIFANIFDASVKNAPAAIMGYAPSSAANSVLVGDGMSICKQGETCKFVVLVYDAHDNLQLKGEDDVVDVKFDDATTKLLSIVKISKGQYSVSYQGGSVGSVLMTVLINNKPIEYRISMTLNNTSIGLTAGAGFLAIVLGGSGYYLARKQAEIKKMRKEWENMRQAVYKDYQINPDIASLGDVKAGENFNDEEWEGEEVEGRGELNDAEWEAMENWFERKRVIQ